MDRFDPRGRVNRALLVGVSAYEFTRREHRHGVPSPLPAVAHNLSLLAGALERGGVVGPGEITVADSPVLGEFRKELRTAVDAAEGLLLLYFAGHGAVPSAGDELWLQMRDAEVVRGGTAGFEGAAPFTNVLRILANSDAERIVVVLDCCNAGNAARVWEAVERPDIRRRVSVLMGVQANHRIDAGDGDTPTPFTARLVDLLTDGVEGQGDEVHFLALSEALRVYMSAHHRTERGEPWEPQSRTENPPVDVLLAVRPGATAPGGETEAGAGRTVGAGSTTPTGAAGRTVPAGSAGSAGSAGHVGTTASTGPGGPGGPGGTVTGPARRGPGAPARLRIRGLLAAAARAVRAARTRVRPTPARRPPTSPAEPRPPGRTPRPRTPWRSPRLWPRRTAVAATGLAVAVLGLTGYLVLGHGASGGAPCAPPLELRLLTDPDLESTVRKAADTYLTSTANTTDDGCRRSGITVYGAGSAAVVAGLRDQSDPWQRPVGDEVDPQRDIGPQPDIWIPATAATAARARPTGLQRSYVSLEPDPAPFAYSPVVLSVPQEIAEASVADRTGDSLTGLRQKLTRRDGSAEVRRPDPAYTDSALLATVGLYGTGTPDVSRAEESVDQTGPVSPTAGDLLCTLPDNADTDRGTAALVPEFLMVSGVGCDRTTRTLRMAEYPDDVPALAPLFVRVRWTGGHSDGAARDDAVRSFHDWLTGTGGGSGDGHGTGGGSGPGGGLAVFGKDGFRSPSGAHALLSSRVPDAGLIADPGRSAGAAGADAMETALKRYRNANGPGRVLFLLDSSGSMADLWQGPGGAPGILKQSFAGLGDRDEYGVWSVASPGSRPYGEILPFGRHKRQDAERAVDRGAVVQDAEADPYGALEAALDTMAGKGRDDNRPELIVFLTDDEDNNRLTAHDHVGELLKPLHDKGVPVVMAALDSGGCAKGSTDQRMSEASGGRCLDTRSDLVADLRNEVARTGTGDE
ncbi:VWA domain-containing protein [Streptomyces sp. NBC_01571]|uniref:vWA domain-containing protein n=1 Tax=Streptomyces sp. NBC_01571 TaxID=2975883 RepID=UPI00225761F4|nr:vWA domain-containing protein [Streptomyces sp. NBC_01571]MCX4576355.1 VWA domain-containing protein [Streptomyces sp. NBC_01571]